MGVLVCAGALSELEGWTLDGERVPPLAAYTRAEDWLLSFEAQFPERKKRMREYSKAQGWSETRHRITWLQVVPAWLDKQRKGE